MKKSIYSMMGLAVLFGALFAIWGTKEASAQVQVNIGIAAPPPLQFAAPPDMYVVPSGSSYVYMVPDYDGVYFYGGNWYRSYNNHWFRSSHYNGSWGYIEQSNVPQVIMVVPPEYIHYVPSGYYRIHYNDFYGNWQTWDQRRHWDSYDWYNNERRDDTRRERYNRIDMDRQQRGVQTLQHQQGRQQHTVLQQPQQYDVQKHSQHQSTQHQQKQKVQKSSQQHTQHQQNQKVKKSSQQHTQHQQNQKVKKSSQQHAQHQQNQKAQKHSSQQQPKQQKQQHQQNNNKDKGNK